MALHLRIELVCCVTAFLSFGQSWSVSANSGNGLSVARSQITNNQSNCTQQNVGPDTIRIHCVHIDLSSYELLRNILVSTATRNPDSLIMLEIVRSTISDIPSDILKDYTISELALNYNQLVHFPQRHLNNINAGQLSILNLADNLITNISAMDFYHLPFVNTLSILDLSRNLLNNIPPHVFDSFKNLATLNLQENALKLLASEALMGLSNLYDLNLSFNSISYMDRDALPKPSQLMVLLLNDNQLQFLEEDTLSSDSFSDLRDLALDNNPFYCNCSLIWLKQFLDSCQQTFSSGATCSYPLKAPFYNVDFCP